MKRNYRYDNWLIATIVCLLMGCNTPTQQQTSMPSSDTDSVYYCPMHPDVEQNHPGKCPKPECHGMALMLKPHDAYLKIELQSVSSNVLSSIRVVQPEFKQLPIQVEALGYLDYDNYSKFDISSRYSGRIDKLYIKYNYQPIKKGEIVFEVYSADLVTAQENLLYLLRTSSDEKELIAAAKQKLKLLQLTDEQINEIISTKKVKSAIPVFSKYDGHIHEMIDSKASAEMSDYQKSPLLSVKEGMYVERGKILFNVVDPSKVVVMLKVKASDIGKVRIGEKVNFFVNNDTSMMMNGKIDFIEPIFNVNAKSLMVRVNMENDNHKHKIGSLVNATIVSDSLKTLWIPESAIVDLGKSKIVWIQKDGSFKAIKVEIGVKSLGMVEIADGLTEMDKIALEAHYLSDSEGFVKVDEDE